MPVYEMPLPVKLYPWSKPFEITGGPFRHYEMRREVGASTYGVKLAPEVESTYDLMLPIDDFSVPADERHACACALLTFRRILNGERVYTGCMGGTGRTGLFLALIVKALGSTSPIAYVRKNYKRGAVETQAQERWVDTVDVFDLGMRMKTLLWQKRIFPFLSV